MNVSYVPMALKAGAQLFTNARAEKILIENGRAVGVVAFTEGRRRLTVRARAVVVAAGTLLSPVLLMANGLCGQSGQLGKNLSIHPALASWAFFDEKIEGYRGVPQGYAIESFRDQGLLFEGGFTPLDIGGPSFSMIGEAWTRIVADYDRIACFGFMIEDTSRGRVFKGPGLRPLISYFLNAHDVARLKHGAEILARVYFAAGAKEIIPSIHGFDSIASERDLDRLRRAHLTARDFDLTAYHPLGTCRMGVDPNASVVGPDHQAHDVKGLYVTDGSAVPSSLAVNPQLTIMALSMRASEYIGKALAAS